MKLNGKKLSSELFDVEHGLLLQDSDLCLELKSADTGIFRACHTKVKKSVQFVEQLRVNCKSFVCSPFHVKRIMPSPLTPKHSTNSDEHHALVQPKSRKRLKVTFDNESHLP